MAKKKSSIRYYAGGVRVPAYSAKGGAVMAKKAGHAAAARHHKMAAHHHAQAAKHSALAASGGGKKRKKRRKGSKAGVGTFSRRRSGGKSPHPTARHATRM